MSQNQIKSPVIPDDDVEYWSVINQLFEYYFIQPNSTEFPSIRYDLGDFRTDGGDVNEADIIIYYFISDFIDISMDNLYNEAIDIYFKALYRCQPLNINVVRPLLEKVAESSSNEKISILYMLKCSAISQVEITYDKMIYYYYDIDNKQADENYTSCDICQIEYENGNYIQSLSCKCNHNYHHSCINNWFKVRLVCPYCSSDVIIPDVRIWKKNNQDLYLSMESLAILYKSNSHLFINDATDEYVYMAEVLMTYNLLNLQM